MLAVPLLSPIAPHGQPCGLHATTAFSNSEQAIWGRSMTPSLPMGALGLSAAGAGGGPHFGQGSKREHEPLEGNGSSGADDKRRRALQGSVAISAAPAPDSCKSERWLPLWQQEGWSESAAHPGTFTFRPTDSWFAAIKAELAGQRPGGRPRDAHGVAVQAHPAVAPVPLEHEEERTSRRVWLKRQQKPRNSFVDTSRVARVGGGRPVAAAPQDGAPAPVPANAVVAAPAAPAPTDAAPSAPVSADVAAAAAVPANAAAAADAPANAAAAAAQVQEAVAAPPSNVVLARAAAVLAWIAHNQHRFQAVPDKGVPRGWVLESAVRNAMKDSPDTSKALRWLVRVGRLEQRGRGGRVKPFHYRLARRRAAK